VSFRRAVASNVALQTIGPASSFATVFVIARLGGPSDQGQFAQMKAWVDLMVAIGCFGFPQGFVYVINKLDASPAALARWSTRYSLAFIPIALIGSAIAVRFRLLITTAEMPSASLAFLTAATALLVLHGLWRGIYLTYNSGPSFAFFTVLPAVTLLVVISIGMWSGAKHYDRLILLASISMFVIATFYMRPLLQAPSYGLFRDQPWGPLLSNGFHAFLQAMLLALQPIVAYRFVRSEGGANQEIAFLHVGLLLVQGLSVPVSMVAPLLFARWTAALDHSLMGRLHQLSLRALSLGFLAGGALALAARIAIPLIFGRQYSPAVAPVQVMLLTVPLLCHVRIIAPALHARGRPMVNTAAGLVRLIGFSLLTTFLVRRTHNFLLAIASAWAAAEILAAAWTLSALRLAAHGEPQRDPGSTHA
jgi:O-antigen/teichoic acid export membrane protein